MLEEARVGFDAVEKSRVDIENIYIMAVGSPTQFYALVSVKDMQTRFQKEVLT